MKMSEYPPPKIGYSVWQKYHKCYGEIVDIIPDIYNPLTGLSQDLYLVVFSKDDNTYAYRLEDFGKYLEIKSHKRK